MGVACGEVPEIAALHVVDEHSAIGLHDTDTGFAGEHDGPLVGEVPVQLAEGTGGKTHVHSGEVL